MSARAWRGRRWRASVSQTLKYACALERRRKSCSVYGVKYGFPALIRKGGKP